MSELVIDPLTLRELQSALNVTFTNAFNSHRSVSREMRKILLKVEEAVSLRKLKVHQCESRLQSCQQSGCGDCSFEILALAEARRRLDSAFTAQRCASQAVSSFESHSRASLKLVERIHIEGQWYLRNKLDKVKMINPGGIGGAVNIPKIIPFSSGTPEPDAVGVYNFPGLPPGFAMIPVSCIDQTENPINVAKDFGKGYSIEDFDYAFDLLEYHVLPGLASGSTIDSFAKTDRINGNYGTRSLSDTYHGFFGHDAIRLELRPDGSYSIANGRHRVFVASKFGRHYVPARIIRGDQ